MHDLDIVIEHYNDSLWVAGYENGALEAFEIDPAEEGVRYGSIYWARVDALDPKMNAAFVDLGHGESGLLSVKDFRRFDKDGNIIKNEGKPISKLLTPGEMILVQSKNTVDLVNVHDPHLARESKSARVSMNISIPGRYLIFTPFDLKKKVSSRVTSAKIRKKMLGMIEDIDSMQGCIMRSSASSVQTDILTRESKILRAIWDQLKNFQQGDTPALIMLGPNAIQRVLGDQADRHITKIETSDGELYEEIHEWCDLYAPEFLSRLSFIDPEEFETTMGLFDHYDLIPQIESLISPFSILPSGGNIIIQETAALIAIDVNSGASKSKPQTNIEAAKECARQIRLRNLSGTILIDFINTSSKKQHTAILGAFKEKLSHDPCSVSVHGFTNLGLLEISREKRTPAIATRFASLLEDYDE